MPSPWFIWGPGGEYLYSYESISESSSSTGRRGLCPERISDLSEKLQELGLDVVLVWGRLVVEEWPGSCGRQAEGQPSLPGESFPGHVRTAWELYKILVGSLHPHPLHLNPRVTPRHQNFEKL